MRTIPLAGLILTFSVVLLASPLRAQPDDSSTPMPSPSADGTPLASAVPGRSTEATLAFDQPRWRKLTPASGPRGREDHTWTVDSEGRYAYLFGGRDGEQELADLWRYDLHSDGWTRLTPGGASPAPRFGHSAVWADSHGLVIFGGQRGAAFFDDLWHYDAASDRWVELPRQGAAPRARYGSCMIVGPDERLWISHGFTFAGRFDDTRAYDLETGRWSSVGPSRARPGERCLHDCLTTLTGDLVLFGGQDDGALALGDLWVMRGDRTWERLPDPDLAPRRLYAVTEAGADAYLFGGADEESEDLADLWRIDRERLAFERVPVRGRSPAARHAGTLITDVEGGRLLLFGGQGREVKADLWELVDLAPAPEPPPMAEPPPSVAP